MTGWSVAGVGAVASVGADPDEIFASLCAGRTGHGPLRGFDHTKFKAQHAYEIDDRPAAVRDEPLRATRWLCQAIGQAVADAGLGEDLRDIPVLIGTGLRELRSAELWWRDGQPFGLADLHFGTALRERFGATISYTIVNACSASLYALGLASDLLAAGKAETVVVAGTDSITESMYGLLDRVHPQPVDRVRPFDRGRRGVLMGDGAAAVVLRAGPGGRARLRAVGLNCDAAHVTAPDPEGIKAAIQQAHRLAGILPDDLDLVYAHGTGTLLNDEAEAAALSQVLPKAPDGPLVTAIKSMTGHTSGSSGLLSLVMSAESLRTGLIPPTVGLQDPVAEAEGLRFVTEPKFHADQPLRLAQVDAFGFGGLNAVAILERAA